MKFAFLIVVAILLWILYAKWQEAVRRRHIDSFQFHDAVLKKFREARPGLTPAQEKLVFDALREWFHVCNRAGRRFVSMPSQAVDDAWHAFILFTRSYQGFCDRALGRFLHHTPAEAMASPTTAQDGIKRTWRLACARERINPAKPTRLPLLFGIDATLGIANGFTYALHCTPDAGSYCASHIGCSSGCGGSSGNDSSSVGDSSSGSSCGGDGGGGGCGGGGGD